MPRPILAILILVWTINLAGCEARPGHSSVGWLEVVILLTCTWYFGVQPWRRYRARTRRDSPHHLALQRFFEHTGYRLLGMEGSPIESQVQAAADVWLGGPRAPGEPIVPRPYTRDLAGDRLIYYHGAPEDADPWGAPLGQSAWVLLLREPVHTPWSLREKNVGMRLLWTVLTLHRFSRLKPRLPGAILVEPALRARFALYAEDRAAADAVLTEPEIREALLACVDLDLHVLKDRIVFMDPLHRNLAAGSGGMVASQILKGDPERQLELMAMSHMHIAGLLAQIARLCRGRV
jgi:hypothetical protein